MCTSHNFGFYPRHVLLPVQQRLGVLDDSPQNLVIYLARTGARSVANDNEVLARLTQRLKNTNYSLHVFQASGNFELDLSIMRRAKVVLGPHGSAFANLVFTKPGTHVIEFLTTSTSDNVLASDILDQCRLPCSCLPK